MDRRQFAVTLATIVIAVLGTLALVSYGYKSVEVQQLRQTDLQLNQQLNTMRDENNEQQQQIDILRKAIEDIRR